MSLQKWFLPVIIVSQAVCSIDISNEQTWLFVVGHEPSLELESPMVEVRGRDETEDHLVRTISAEFEQRNNMRRTLPCGNKILSSW